MGAGKTTVGRAVAEHLARTWLDSDAEIEADTGLTVRELRDRDGVDAMHAREATQLLHALASPEPSVISAAASVVEVKSCREAMTGKDVEVIWLHASPAVLSARFASADDHRPVYGESTKGFLADQAAVREPLAASIGARFVDVDGVSKTGAVARVVDALG